MVVDLPADLLVRNCPLTWPDMNPQVSTLTDIFGEMKEAKRVRLPARLMVSAREPRNHRA